MTAEDTADFLGSSVRTLQSIEQGRGFRYPLMLHLALTELDRTVVAGRAMAEEAQYPDAELVAKDEAAGLPNTATLLPINAPDGPKTLCEPLLSKPEARPSRR